ncbi:MAG TPA: hypothetical protein VFT22_21240, partial [Kofleriaceae bacterium]|nr:hypothetical protein [Kofleriaceae bacterium]
PHFTFRMRTAGLFARLGGRGAVRLACRATGVASALASAVALVVLGAITAVRVGAGPGVIVAATGVVVGGVAALVARRRIARTGDVEVAFWDVAGEQVYSAAAADYYNLLAHLVAARRRRAEELGRAYAFAPILICNPIALGTADEGSPYERMRQLLPLFAALDRSSVAGAAHALIAINRWAVVDPICARGALRDEVVSVSPAGRGEAPSPARAVAREQVRANCLDAEDGRDQDVRVTYLRYDTAIKTQVEVDAEAATIAYAYDDGPGAFSGAAATRFLDWVIGLVAWPAPRAAVAAATAMVATEPVPVRATASEPAATAPLVPSEPPVPIPETEVWARPQDLPGAR